jgi:hypothetical protein
VEALCAADFINIKMAGYLTWTLDIGYWTLDIDFKPPSRGNQKPGHLDQDSLL